MNPRINRQDKVKERRAASRYDLVLLIEIRVAPELVAAGAILAETQDMSTQGFYFNVAHKVTIGTKFEFSIALPIEITEATQAYIRGMARVVRVDETGEIHAGRSGVGAIIEKYRISLGESVNS
jgi:hypothetical protein